MFFSINARCRVLVQRTVSVCVGSVLLLLSGCMPLKQYNVTGGKRYDGIGYDEEGYGLLQIGSSNQPKTTSIVDAESFAIGPRGKRYSVESEPHPYHLPTS